MKTETTIRFGSDAIVRLLTELGIDYAAFNPGFTFRGIQDSMVNFGPAPRIIECCHEEISVAVAHGYAKAAQKPMVACVHDVVGLQHASMAIFNAWCDRTAVLVLGGTGPRDITKRRVWDWLHTALVEGELVRNYVKWDDEPANLSSVPESLARAYRTAVSRPRGPVYVNFDLNIQEEPVPYSYQLPKMTGYGAPPAPAVPMDRLEFLAKLLAEADYPVIVADRVESPLDVAALADVLGAPALDYGNRLAVPTEHPLNLTGAERDVLAQADLVLGLEVDDFYGVLQRRSPKSETSGPFAPRARIAHIGLNELLLKGWTQDHQRLTAVDLPLVGDPDDAARQLTILLEGRVSSEKRLARIKTLSNKHASLRRVWADTAGNWCEKEGPVHPAALTLAVWKLLDGREFCVANDSTHGWLRRLWKVNSQEQHLGSSGGGGLGYGIGAATGAALAFRDQNKIIVDIQADGDLLYTTSALWTVAKYNLPILLVMDNNRSYFNSQNHARDIAEQRGRPIENWEIGTTIDGPNIDFIGLARSFGVWAEGPVKSAEDLPAALERALEVICDERPALVDVLTMCVLD